MRKIVQLLFIFALALAVPLQGIAAASAAPCRALGHHDTASGHGHLVHDEARGGSTEGAHGHCGPCPGCCVTVFIASLPAALSVPPAAAFAVAQTSPVPHPSLLPDRVERPPLLG